MEKRRKCSSALTVRMNSFDDRIAAKVRKMDFHFEEAERKKETAAAGGSKTEGNKGTSVPPPPLSDDMEETDVPEETKEEDEEIPDEEFSMLTALQFSKLYDEFFYLEPIDPINQRVWRKSSLTNSSSHEHNCDLFDSDEENENSRVSRESPKEVGENRDWGKDARFNELVDSLHAFHLD